MTLNLTSQDNASEGQVATALHNALNISSNPERFIITVGDNVYYTSPSPAQNLIDWARNGRPRYVVVEGR